MAPKVPVDHAGRDDAFCYRDITVPGGGAPLCAPCAVACAATGGVIR